MNLRTACLAAAFAFAACATAPKGAETSPKRVQDSVPERIAAQQAAAPHALQLESENERWGFDAARERRGQEKKAPPKGQTVAPTGSTSVGVKAPR
jgi:hypothetical protein